MDIDIRSLKAFLEVIEAGGFTAAARAQGISQPALSRTIRKLEDELNARLFDRDTRNLALTEVGRELQTTASRLIRELDESLSHITELSRGTRGTIVVASVPTLAATLVPPAIASFLETNPEVVVHVRDVFTEAGTQAVLDGKADMALTIRPPEYQDLRYQFLLSDRFLAVADGASNLQRKAAVDWSVLQTRPFIAFHKGSSIRMNTDAALLQAGLAVRPKYECGEIATVGGMLAAGLGIAALPELALAHLLSHPLYSCPLKSPVMTRSLGILTSSRRALSPPAKSFMAHLVKQAELFVKRRSRTNALSR